MKRTYAQAFEREWKRFWEIGSSKREFIETLAWDFLVVAFAMIGRAGILQLHAHLPQTLNADWGIRALDWVAEKAMVGLAITFAVFDLLKRVAIEAVGLYKSFRPSRPGEK